VQRLEDLRNVSDAASRGAIDSRHQVARPLEAAAAPRRTSARASRAAASPCARRIAAAGLDPARRSAALCPSSDHAPVGGPSAMKLRP
jgi:hypothetical protein